MAFALFTFILTVSYAFFNIILPYWTRNNGALFGTFILILALYFITNLLLNYLLAVFIRPGCVEDLLKSSYYLTNNPYVIRRDLVNLNDVFNNIENKQIQRQAKLERVFDESLINSNNIEANENFQKEIEVNIKSERTITKEINFELAVLISHRLLN